MKAAVYTCIADDMEWEGCIRTITDTLPIEAVITGRGYCFHVIYGRYQAGYYLAVPAFGIGCDMAHYSDVFWNRESLSRTEQLSEYEVETIVLGIRQLTELTGERLNDTYK